MLVEYTYNFSFSPLPSPAFLSLLDSTKVRSFHGGRLSPTTVQLQLYPLTKSWHHGSAVSGEGPASPPSPTTSPPRHSPHQPTRVHTVGQSTAQHTKRMVKKLPPSRHPRLNYPRHHSNVKLNHLPRHDIPMLDH